MSEGGTESGVAKAACRAHSLAEAMGALRATMGRLSAVIEDIREQVVPEGGLIDEEEGARS